MMLLSQARGLKVITVGEAAEVGTVEALTIDASTAGVSHVRLSGRTAGGHDVLPWSTIHAVGPDAVMVRSLPAAETADAAAPPHREALGSRVLTELGDDHGTVEDIAFDPTTGRVRTVHTTLGAVPGQRLLGLGDYALVISAE
ncbi:hypothetical protein BLA24_04500 [Streptomyces cinnamoneus]|uniref:PRC-barrel domain-containing protein n=1 Tax=Streptomyces cinnamoneus TaxID=53446 RepID=A0A2G1XP03_STRCJ|nr:hypothetical protein [Streptomyces cinnamoneus]PHQ52964.1 hypothetical protein BLA24_04500 [Streptomyces cinnamoneus]PPT16290.1 hypothetical protein CYQ11_01760 [Streptomyces cinnamoneus]